MGKIKIGSKNKRRNPFGVLAALLLIGFSTLFFTPIQLYAPVPVYTLNVNISGNGDVWSQVAGIDCPGDCSETYDSGTVVTLKAAPDNGSYFAGFSGDCVSQALTCKVKMDAAKNVTATFNTGTAPTTTWAKTYGGSDIEYSTSVQQTSDGGYIVAGATTSFGAGGYDIWVMKLNPDGSVNWQNTYGGSGDEWANSIQETSDGGYIVAGGTTSFGEGPSDLWILKLNPDGSVNWQNTYGGSGDEWANSIQETSDGGYIAAGITSSFGAGNGDIWILKLDSNGTVTWQKTYGDTGDETANFVKQTSDGGYIVAGSTTSFGAGGYDIWVMKLNPDGSVNWQNTYGGLSDDWPRYTIQQTADGGYILAGSTTSLCVSGYDIWVLKLDSVGVVTWQKIYGGSGNDYVFSIQQTANNGYIVAGYTTSFGSGNNDTWILALNNDGSIAWQKTYGGLYGDYATSIQQTSDGGFIVTGNTYSFGAGNEDIWVLKLDSYGDISGCPGGMIGLSSASVSNTTITGVGTSVTGSDTNISAQPTNVDAVNTNVIPDGICSGLFDTDADGLLDSWEIANFGTLVYGPNDDPDSDGLTNLREYELGTNPNQYDPDNDGDGLPDSVDNCPFYFNPIQASWVDKNGTTHFNSQPDFDLDGIGDPCDPDADNDGFDSYYHGGCDCDDLNPLVYPGDGTCPEVCGQLKPPSPSCTDCDNDGVTDTSDNCPGVNNPISTWVDINGVTHTNEQPDFDLDGKGDACDNCPTFPNANQIIPTWYKDADGDGYSDGTTLTQCTRPTGYKLASELIATIGDCNDNDASVNPGKTEVPNNGKDDDCNPNTPDVVMQYSIVFEISNGNYDTWLPEDGKIATVTAKVMGPSGQINTPVTFTLESLTNYLGKYTNDISQDNSDDFTCSPVPCRSISGTQVPNNQMTFTSLDFGGAIRITTTAVVVLSDATVNVTNTLSLPKDTDNDGLADVWEIANFGNLNRTAEEDPDGDGLSNFKEYRGVYWKKLDQVEPGAGNPYSTTAFVPQANTSHIRTNPTRKDLFVKYTGFSCSPGGDGQWNYPCFAIGKAFYEAGIDVHAVESSVVSSLGDLNIDVMEVTNYLTGTYLGEDGRTWKRGIRDWVYATLGYSNPPNAPNYGTGTRTYQVAMDHYFNNKPYYDGGNSCTGTRSGKLEPINTVQDQNDNGTNEKFGNKYETYPCNQASCLFTTDSVTYVYVNGWYLTPPDPLTCSGTPVGLSSNDINNNGKIELPRVTDPSNVPAVNESTRQQVLKKVITHEMGHSAGATHQTAIMDCVMADPNTSWNNDQRFSDVPKAQLSIHNQ